MAQTAGGSLPPVLVFLVVSVIWRLLMGVIAGVIAERRGRSALWFLGGFFFGVLGIVLVFVSADRSEKSRFRRQVGALARYTQHLEEKMDAVLDYCHSGLQALDENVDGQKMESVALEFPPKPDGLDEMIAELAGERDKNDCDSELPPPSERDLEEKWYFREDGEEVGPITQYELKQHLHSGKLDLKTQVRTENMGAYKNAYDMVELLEVVSDT